MLLIIEKTLVITTNLANPESVSASEVANLFFFFDVHDKLMGFQSSTFSIAIYGCLDTASRKLVWIKVWNSSSSLYLTAGWHFDYLYQSKLLPHLVRLEKGTDTGV